MAVFHEMDAASAGDKKKFTPLMIIAIVLIILLCCCCAAVIIILIATKGDPIGGFKDLFNIDSYVPLYLTLRTWL